MHLVCLGVTKLMLKLWFRNKKSSIISFQMLNQLSNELASLGKHMPKEFNRKPQSILHLKRSKATVLRFYLLYAGPIIMQKYIDSNNMYLFNLLSAAIRILCDVYEYKENNELAKSLLQKFVKEF